jgi:hypothetical protein
MVSDLLLPPTPLTSRCVQSSLNKGAMKNWANLEGRRKMEEGRRKNGGRKKEEQRRKSHICQCDMH